MILAFTPHYVIVMAVHRYTGFRWQNKRWSGAGTTVPGYLFMAVHGNAGQWSNGQRRTGKQIGHLDGNLRQALHLQQWKKSRTEAIHTYSYHSPIATM